MGKKSKKNGKETQSPPVVTGKDERAKQAAVNHSFRDRRGGSDAPDGVSGNWS